MRIHCLENVDKALQFLKEQRVHLENMGSHDIVDGNHRLTLGLIWTIILRFQVRSFAKEAASLKNLAKLSAREFPIYRAPQERPGCCHSGGLSATMFCISLSPTDLTFLSDRTNSVMWLLECAPAHHFLDL